jgi:hypothetical protein
MAVFLDEAGLAVRRRPISVAWDLRVSEYSSELEAQLQWCDKEGKPGPRRSGTAMRPTLRVRRGAPVQQGYTVATQFSQICRDADVPQTMTCIVRERGLADPRRASSQVSARALT